MVVLVLGAGGLAGWFASDGGERAEAKVPVRYLPAAALQDNGFTPPAEIRSPVKVSGSGPFGGTGSDLVCDRERLIRFLTERPDRLRAWAKVLAIEPTAAAVALYIRALKPSTLLAPARVTNHSYIGSRAVAFQAVLAAGTSVLVDEKGAIRVRCRCGNPLLDPMLASSETCQDCPSSYRLQTAWQLASVYYALHPSPPPVKGEATPERDVTSRTVRVIRTIAAGYVLEEKYVDADGEEHTRIITVPEPPKPRPKVIEKTKTVTVESPPRTVFVPEIQTVTVQQTVPQVRTVTVYRDEG